MDDTPNLKLPYILAAQAQKHVTHNEAIRILDALVQLAVVDRDLTTPPGSPAEGARYIIATGASGAWAGHDLGIAAWQDGVWSIHESKPGWLAWIEDEEALVVFDGSDWISASEIGSLQDLPMVGINATADSTNRLAVSAPTTLLSHEGAGHQLKINKAGATDTASLLYQTAFSGRAEFGLTGDDDFHVKVSPNGSTWHTALTVDRSSGAVTLPNTSIAGSAPAPNLLVNGDFQINQRVFAGGSLSAGVYGFDRWKADTGGANVTLSGFTVTLTSGTVLQILKPSVFGYGSLASTQVTLSVGDLSGGSLSITIGSQTATITAGSGRRSATVTLGGGDSGNISVKLAPASGAVTFNRAKLEAGSSATAWQARPVPHELALCRRYYRKTYPTTVAPGTASSRPGAVGIHTQMTDSFHFVSSVTWQEPMRAAPTVTAYNPDTGSTSTPIRSTSASTNHAATIDQIGQTGFFVFVASSSIAAGQRIITHYTADAEL
jgi:hypothetical protein